jgi:hypothetical protein
MRLVLLAAVLAGACDQGAVAAPPQHEQTKTQSQPLVQSPAPTRYAVRDDADFVAKVRVVFGEMIDMFADHSTDCARVAVRIEDLAARNVTRFAVLVAYGKEHPRVEKSLQQELKPELDDLVKAMTPSIQACAQDKRLQAAFERLARDANAQQFQQRPR